MNNVLLSIIIPCYNSATFLDKTLKNLSEQGLTGCEIILVDDGSTDKTLSIMKKFASIHTEKIVQIISQKNLGVSVARNVGVKVAKGQFICFLDSDDELAPNTIDFYKQKITNNLDVDFFTFAYKKVKNSVSKEYRMLKENRFESMYSGEEALERYLLKKFPIHICSLIVRKNFLIENQIFFSPGVKIGEDTEFILRVLLGCKKVFYSSRICFLYLIRANSVTETNTYSKENFESFLIKKNLLRKLPSRDIERNINFYLDNFYFFSLLKYLKVKQFNFEITNGFIENKEIFKKPFTHVKGLRTLIFIIFRYVPVRLLLYLFKKEKVNRRLFNEK